MVQGEMALLVPPESPGVGMLLGPSWLGKKQSSGISLGSGWSPAVSPAAWIWGAAQLLMCGGMLLPGAAPTEVATLERLNCANCCSMSWYLGKHSGSTGEAEATAVP